METEDLPNGLAQLKCNLREEAHPFFTDEQLVQILDEWNQDITRASFHGLIAKSENDEITLPSGISMPNNAPYWLKLAKKYRQNAGGTMKRGDEICP